MDVLKGFNKTRLWFSCPLIGHYVLLLASMSTYWQSCPLFGHHVLLLAIMSFHLSYILLLVGYQVLSLVIKSSYWLVILSSYWSSCHSVSQSFNHVQKIYQLEISSVLSTMVSGISRQRVEMLPQTRNGQQMQCRFLVGSFKRL